MTKTNCLLLSRLSRTWRYLPTPTRIDNLFYDDNCYCHGFYYSAAISTATAATSVFLKLLKWKSWGSGSMMLLSLGRLWTMSKAEGIGPSMTMRLDFLSTIHSMSVRKGRDEDEDSADDLDGVMNTATTTAATATKKKPESGIKKKVKMKTNRRKWW